MLGSHSLSPVFTVPPVINRSVNSTNAHCASHSSDASNPELTECELVGVLCSCDKPRATAWLVLMLPLTWVSSLISRNEKQYQFDTAVFQATVDSYLLVVHREAFMHRIRHVVLVIRKAMTIVYLSCILMEPQHGLSSRQGSQGSTVGGKYRLVRDDLRTSLPCSLFPSFASFSLFLLFLNFPFVSFVQSLLPVIQSSHLNMTTYLELTGGAVTCCLLYTSPSPRDGLLSRMPSSA